MLELKRNIFFKKGDFILKIFLSDGKLNVKIGNKIAWVDRKRLTFLLTVYDLKTKEDKMYYM